MYKSRDDAEFRLSGCIIGLDGRPVLVRSVTGDNDAVRLNVIEHPFSGKSKGYDCGDPSFDKFKTIPLGFMNFFDYGHSHTTFCERIPARRTRQGLDENNFRATVLRTGTRITLEECRASESFNEMVLGVYPEYAEVMEVLSEDSSIALSRDFALLMDNSGIVNVFNRRDRVGIILRDVVLLRKDFAFLRETILEEGILPGNVDSL